MNRTEKKVERDAAISERRAQQLAHAVVPVAVPAAEADAELNTNVADGEVSEVLPMRASDFDPFWQQNQSLEKCATRYQTSLDGFARDEGDCDDTIRHRCKSDKRPTRGSGGLGCWCGVV